MLCFYHSADLDGKALQDKSAKIEADPRLKDARLLTASKTPRGITFHFVWEDE